MSCREGRPAPGTPVPLAVVPDALCARGVESRLGAAHVSIMLCIRIPHCFDLSTRRFESTRA